MTIYNIPVKGDTAKKDQLTKSLKYKLPNDLSLILTVPCFSHNFVTINDNILELSKRIELHHVLDGAWLIF